MLRLACKSKSSKIIDRNVSIVVLVLEERACILSHCFIGMVDFCYILLLGACDLFCMYSVYNSHFVDNIEM